MTDPCRTMPPGERGELWLRGPQVMAGYWNRPDETAGVITDGWLRTGDVAVMDPDGFFRIVDRIKEMTDGEGGEMVKAFVVLRQGATVSPEELLAWCRDPKCGLAGYRVPRAIEVRTSLPETIIGKVLRRVLREEEVRRLESGEASASPDASA